ncbi:MAG: nucleotidyltransferase [Patescibacteria group bacterium]|nr:nucleotidyltransferase [Patescibacteria group bacterium]
MTINQDRLQVFFARFPLLLPVVTKLNEAGIPFAIGGSGCLYLFGNERQPDDVDIYLPDDKHDEADKLFGIESYTYKSEMENVRNSNPQGDHSIQLTSHLTLSSDGKTYKISLNDHVLSHATKFEYEGQTILLLPVEDVLLIKALLQRGPEVNKHDIEDIRRFLAIQPNIDRDYLKSRVRELGAEGRVGNIFNQE